MRNEDVAGEEVDAIGAALLLFKFDPPDEDGMTHVEAHGTTEELAPLWRAIMRIEAEMLTMDAECYPDTKASRRTPGQRRHDALERVLDEYLAVVRKRQARV